MNVHLAGDFESDEDWCRAAASVSTALRDAGFDGWHIMIRPCGRGEAIDAGLGCAVQVDVAGMHLDAAYPTGATPDNVADRLIGAIAEAEDETENDYGPTDEDDH